MSKYRFHYTETSPGNPIADVSLRSVVAPQFTVDYGVVEFKKRYLLFANSTAGSGYFAISHNPVDADAARANFDLLTVLNWGAISAQFAGLIGRASGAATATYYAAVLFTSGSLQIIKVVAGVSTALATSAFSLVGGKQYFLRFNATGTSLSLKCWSTDSSEPAAANVSVTDSSITAAGSVGVSMACAANNQIAPFNFLSVGTGSDIAETPILNRQYTAWLSDQTKIREWLFEFAGTGYNAGVFPYTKTVNIYVSQVGFVSKPWDTPPSRAYSALIKSIPTFDQALPAGLTGEAVTGFGELVLDNSNAGKSYGAGEPKIDSLLRMRINRSFVRGLLGQKEWSRHDFREQIVGRIGQPTTPSATTLAFKIQDLSSAFNVPLSTGSIASGQYQGARNPVLLGNALGQNDPLGANVGLWQGIFIEPPLIDKNANVYKIHDAAITTSEIDPFARTMAYDNLKPIATVYGLGIAGFNNATATLTATAPHGMLPGYRCQFEPGAGSPAPFLTGVDYYVLTAGLTLTDFRLSATPGGAAIAPTSGSGTTKFRGLGFNFNLALATMTTVAPAMRVTVGGISTAPLVYDEIFRRSGLSSDFKDVQNFYNFVGAATLGTLYYPPGATTCAEALRDFAQGTFSWYTFTPDGLMQIGKLALPAATPVMTFDANDFPPRSIKLVNEIPSVNFASPAQRTYAPWYLAAGAFQSGEAQAIQGKSYVPTIGYGLPNIPLDNHPDLLDSDMTTVFDTICNDTSRALELIELFKIRLAVFEVQLRLRAIELSIGQTISLTDDRMGWRLWNSGAPASPDNTATLDSRLAVVVGKSFNPNGGAFPVTLKLMRRMPGYYPVQDYT
jgi:hypothetical protein